MAKLFKTHPLSKKSDSQIVPGINIGYIVIDSANVLLAIESQTAYYKDATSTSEELPKILHQEAVQSPGRRSNSSDISLLTKAHGRWETNQRRLQHDKAEWRREYLQRVARMANAQFSQQYEVCGIVLGGTGDYKDGLRKQLDAALLDKVLLVSSTSSGGQKGLQELFHAAKKNVSEARSRVDSQIIDSWIKELHNGMEADAEYFHFAVGIEQCEKAIVACAVRKLLLSYHHLRNLTRCEWRRTTPASSYINIASSSSGVEHLPAKPPVATGCEAEVLITYCNKDETPTPPGLRAVDSVCSFASSDDTSFSTEGHHTPSFRLVKQKSVLPWLVKYCVANAIAVHWILGQGSEADNFHLRFGGILCFLWFPLEGTSPFC